MNRLTFLGVSLSLVISAGVVAQPVTAVNQRLEQTQTDATKNTSHVFIGAAASIKGSIVYAGSNAPGGRFFGFNNFGGDYLGFYSHNSTPMYFNIPASTTQLTVTTTGVHVGSNPAETAVRLTVNGAINVTGNIAAKYQDVAEWVPSFGDPQPGTVVILSEEASNHVVASHEAYDTRVAGVISHQPGLILGEPGDTKVQVATTGRVKVMVDASTAPIRIGDLLVTSDKPGVAMRSIPVEVAGIAMHRPGTVVGKALEPLAQGTGEILVLLSMQ